MSDLKVNLTVIHHSDIDKMKVDTDKISFGGARTEEEGKGADMTDMYHFYAMYYVKPGSRKTAMFYFGQHVSESGEQVTQKFLQSVGNRTKFYFDWPKRDEIATVNKAYILAEVKFDGPPPFLLGNKQLRKVENSLRKFEQ